MICKQDFLHAVDPHAADTPLYEQLAKFIRLNIRQGRFVPGDQLLPENDLCELLNISRTTVRRALELLVDEGHIIRYRRKGSFIANTKLRRPLNTLYSFTDNMQKLGVSSSSVVLYQEVCIAPPAIAEILHLPENQLEVFYLKRLRCADGRPVLLEGTYIPYTLCPSIEQLDFTTGSLYTTLEQTYNLNLCHASETIAAILIREDEARLLHCQTRDPGYRITRISNLDNGTPYEYTTSVTRADMCEYQIELYHNRNDKTTPHPHIQRSIHL